MPDINYTISVDQWRLDDTYGGVYPKGARDKDVYFSPAETAIPEIKPNHRYLFKKSFARYPWQFWMEVIAYRVGQVMGVEVPPTYVGVHNLGEHGLVEYGALIEWFYVELEEFYFDGGRFMARAIENFDVSKGTQHNFITIFKTIPEEIIQMTSGFYDIFKKKFEALFSKDDIFLKEKMHLPPNLPDVDEVRKTLVRGWADTLSFDTVIGNTDRHQDNWGWIFSTENLDSEESECDQSRPCIVWIPSPAFDNGIALNHEILEQNFHKFDDEKYLLNYLTKPTRAKHHMKWSLDEPEPMNFYEFMRRYVVEYPFVKEQILKRLDFSQSDLEERLSALPAMVDDPTCRLTERRLEFIIQMMMRRRELLLKAINA